MDKLSRQNNWDVALSVGVHQQVNPVDQGAQPYGAVSVNYNFARRAIDKHLDHAVEAAQFRENWKHAFFLHQVFKLSGHCSEWKDDQYRLTLFPCNPPPSFWHPDSPRTHRIQSSLFSLLGKPIGRGILCISPRKYLHGLLRLCSSSLP